MARRAYRKVPHRTGDSIAHRAGYVYSRCHASQDLWAPSRTCSLSGLPSGLSTVLSTFCCTEYCEPSTSTPRFELWFVLAPQVPTCLGTRRSYQVRLHHPVRFGFWMWPTATFAPFVVSNPKCCWRSGRSSWTTAQLPQSYARVYRLGNPTLAASSTACVTHHFCCRSTVWHNLY